MNRDFLLELLSNIKNGRKEYRDNCAQKIINSPDLHPLLVSETFNIDNKLSIKAAWVLEWICTKYNLEFIHPYIDEFSQKLNLLEFEGSIRSCAKICEHLSENFHTNNNPKNTSAIKLKHINLIIENSFDWIIGDKPIAVKAYSITSLYYFGFYTDWVHNELEKIITSDIVHISKACEARGKKILKLLQKTNS